MFIFEVPVYVSTIVSFFIHFCFSATAETFETYEKNILSEDYVFIFIVLMRCDPLSRAPPSCFTFIL